MKINLIAFGIAKDILQSKQLEFELAEGDTISSLKKKLFQQYPEFSKLKSLSFAVGESYEGDFSFENSGYCWNSFFFREEMVSPSASSNSSCLDWSMSFAIPNAMRLIFIGWRR